MVLENIIMYRRKNHYYKVFRMLIYASENKMLREMLNKKRINIDLLEDVFRNLSIMAASEGKNIKDFIEPILKK